MNIKLSWGVFCLLILSLVSACKKDSDDDVLLGDWSRMADFEGYARNGAACFVLGDTAYVGTGNVNTGASTKATRVGDFMKYDVKSNNWYPMASLPVGKERAFGVAFSVGGKGFVGTGTLDGVTGTRDFFEYDPAKNIWREVASLPAEAAVRYGAVAFAINGKGYVGCGTDGNNDFNDLWEYTPAANAAGSWRKVASINTKRQFPFVFVINNKAYVGGGYANATGDRSFYAFDPSAGSAGTWTRLHSLNPDGDPEETDAIKNNDDYNYNITRQKAVAFAIGSYGYVTTGNSGAALNTTWQYNPSSDVWVQADTFEGTSRQEAVGFAIGEFGYVTTGTTGASRLYDTWRFDPNASDDD